MYQTTSSENYHLRRYFPDVSLTGLVEQFWFVSWDLPKGLTHTQENLPDPNFHLIMKQSVLKIIGPVRKKYSFCMEGQGQIIGVKFSVGALSKLLNNDLSQHIDKEILAQEIFGKETIDKLYGLIGIDTDELCVNILQSALLPYSNNTYSPCLLKTKELISKIQNCHSITTVEKLSLKSSIPVRTIQRYFKKYVGLTPKWLIRKYRLRHALESLEAGQKTVVDIVDELAYADQSHLIRDFKDLLGVTPSAYLANKNT